MTQLYLIRHGQAISAARNMLGNTGLSPLGIIQAERLRDRLAASGEIAADVLIASTMQRAKETAEIIAPALGLPLLFDSEVEEWRDGEAGNWTTEEFKARFNPVEAVQKPYIQIAPGAESWAQFMLRASTALNRITTEYAGQTIVIVCHGGIIDCSFIAFLGLSILHLPRAFFNTHNTSITHWYRGSFEDLPTSWLLESYNDVMHLRDIGAQASIPWRGLAVKPVIGKEQAHVPTEAEEAEAE
jgi:2,3-bisphosphoglycerate-dependent phosphoglycerate mutase